jgi:hypothetical protein
LKRSINGASENFLPFEITSYGTDSTLFESRKEYLRKERKIGKSDFYKLIFDGKLDILVGNGNKFYIGTDTSRLIYYLNRKDFLYYLTSDQPELKQLIKHLKFSESRFVELMKVYHNSLNLSNYKVYFPKYTVANLDLFIVGGYNLSFLNTLTESGSSIQYSTSYSPMVGYGVDYFPPVRFGRSAFSFTLQNRFTKELFQSQLITQSGLSTIYSDIVFEGFVIEVPLGVKFQKKLSKDYKIYIMPGSIWKKYKPVEARAITDVVSNDEVTTTISEIDYYAQSTISFFLSAGVERKLSTKNKLFVDFNVDRAGSNTFKRHSFSISVGYKVLNYKFND